MSRIADQFQKEMNVNAYSVRDDNPYEEFKSLAIYDDEENESQFITGKRKRTINCDKEYYDVR